MSNRVRIDAELNDGVSRKLNNIANGFDRLGGPGSGASLFGNVGAKAIGFGFGLIESAASGVASKIFDTVDAFSRLEQSTGGVDAVFGDARQAIDDFAATAAEKAGLSKAAVFEMATVIGAKLTGMGMDVDAAAATVVNLEQRAADMAATFGGTTTDAINAISSALTGERDPIEKYGVSLKEADVQARILALGLDTSTTEAKKQATAIATLDLIMQGTTATEGKFAAETDTLAGKQAILNAKMENASAQIGERLTPLMENLASFVITDVVPAIDAFGRGWDKVAGFISDVIDLIADAIGGFIRVNKQIGEFLGKIGKVNGISAFPTIPGLPLPHFAGGGWAGLHGPEMVMVGEEGPEYIRRAGTGTGDGGHGHPIILDGRQVAIAVDRHLEIEAYMTPSTSQKV